MKQKIVFLFLVFAGVFFPQFFATAVVGGNLCTTVPYEGYVVNYTANSNGLVSFSGGVPSQFITKRICSGANVIVSAELNVGYKFDKWSDGNKNQQRQDSNINQNINVTAYFKPITFTLKYIAGQNGKLNNNLGQVTRTVSYQQNGPQISVTPDSGYRFSGWDDGSLANPRQDRYVMEDMVLTANFEPITAVPYFTINSVYRDATILNRKFDPGISDITKDTIKDPIDPYSDIDCVIKFPTGTYPRSQTFVGKLLSPLDTVLNSGNFSYKATKNDSQSGLTYDYFTWTIEGYKNGAMPSIVPGGLNQPVNQVLINDPKIKCQIVIENSIIESAIKKVSLCSHYWGDLGKAVEVGNLPKDITNGFNMVINSQAGFENLTIPYVKSLKNQLESIDPFASYQNNFAYYFDVKGVDKNKVKKIDDLSKYSNCNFYKPVNPAVFNSGETLYYFSNRYLGSTGSIANFEIPNSVSINLDVTGLPYVLVHEFGHYFGIRDEYSYSGIHNSLFLWTAVKAIGIGKTNCTDTPACSAWDAKYPIYSNTNYIRCRSACTSDSLSRSTDKSIMGQNWIRQTDIVPQSSAAKFNLISCGMIMDVIRPSGQSGANITDCASMDIQKDNGNNIAFSSPLLNDEINEGSTLHIAWTTKGVVPNNITFYLSNRNGVEFQIFSVPGSQTSYNWTVPNDHSMIGRWKLIAVYDNKQDYFVSRSFNIFPVNMPQ